MKRSIALLMCIAVVFSMIPSVVFADSSHEPQGANDYKIERLPGTSQLNSVWLNGDKLSGTEREVYSKLVEMIPLVASGSRASTSFEMTFEDIGLQRSYTASDLGVESIIENDSISEQAVDALLNRVRFDLDRVIKCLLADLPYDLYWFDKTGGYAQDEYSIVAEYSEDLGTFIIYISNDICINLAVAAEYAAGEYLVDTELAVAASGALAKARSIVEQYSGVSDYDKLLGYKSAICGFVSYDHEAAGNSSTPYGNPWQMIWVFDDDPSTNVVCEGYAKAFQYLCDITEFNSDMIVCRTVTGTMKHGDSSENHMWNVITMDNGKNYLVDVTNCDTGAVGADDLLFLVGCLDGDVYSPYRIQCGTELISYQYDYDTLLFDHGPLELCDSSYKTDSYEYTENGIKYLISGSYAAVSGYEGEPENIVIPDTVNGAVVTEIREAAFKGCASLKSISIPDTVVSIKSGGIQFDWDTMQYHLEGAFTDCTSLERVEFGKDSHIASIGKVTFYNCTSLKTFSWPATVETIPESCFSNCSSLQTIDLPEGLREIGQNALSGTSIKSLLLPSTLTEFCDWMNMYELESITVSDGNQSYRSEDGILYGINIYNEWVLINYPWKKTATVYRVPDFVGRSINGDAIAGRDHGYYDGGFEPRPYLEIVDIGTHEFVDLGRLSQRIIMDENNPYYTIVDDVVYDKDMKTVVSVPGCITGEFVIPDGVTTVGELAFDHANVTSIVLPETLINFKDFAFCGCPHLEKITMPDEVGEFGICVFYLDHELTDVNIPKNISVLPPSTFSECTELKSISIPDNITVISESAFARCYKLKEIFIPKSVMTIDHDAFYYVFALSSVYYEGTEEEWNQITIIPGAEDYLLKANRYYNSTGLGNSDSPIISDSGSCGDDVNWVLNTDGTLVISGTGAITSYPWGYDNDQIDSIVIEEGVTSICANAFSYLRSLRYVTLPASITHIGYCAFQETTGLLEVRITDLNAWLNIDFENCPMRAGAALSLNGEVVKDLIIPDGTTSIPSIAFEGCTSIKSVTIPLSVKVIGGGAFNDCNHITDVYYEGTEAEWNEINLSGNSRLEGAVKHFEYGNAIDHDWGDWTVTEAATCTEAGIESRECSRCHAKQSRTTDALGHDYVAVVTAPTCTEKGYTTHTCSHCNDSYVDTYVDALGHDWSDWTVTKAATCAEAGTESRECSRCHEKETRSTAALGHDYIAAVTAPTCTEKGYTTHTCSHCGYSYIDTYVDALGHNWSDWTVTKAATCTEAGAESRECSRCHEKETRSTAALGHDYIAAVTAPTCTEKGYTTHTCSHCGDSYVDTYVDALGHNWSDWTVTKAATCTEAGAESRECSRCHEKETRSTAALGHDYIAAVTAPTCTEKGYTTHTCSHCGDSYVDTYVDALGHNWGSPVYTWAEDHSSCTATVACSIDASHIETETVTASAAEVLPTMYAEGSVTYTAEFNNPLFEAQQKSIVLTRLPKSGWLKEDSKWYFYKDDIAQTGWVKVDGKWYYFNTSGVMQKGWQKVDGKWYYLNPAGDMVTGWKKISDKWYYFNSGGVMQTGWQKVDGKWYYMNSGGVMQTGWQKIDSKWYYMNSGGVMQTGWQKIDGEWYYFNSGGVMQTGWQQINSKWYYFNSSGVMQSSKWIGNYYLKADGSMAVNEYTPDGYYVGSDGKWVKEVSSNIVFWTPNGSVYHKSKNCPSLQSSSVILEGTIEESKKPRVCKVCGNW